MNSDSKNGEILPGRTSVIRCDTLVTLLGGGDVDAHDLADSLARAPALVAADSGADRAMALGYRPDSVIGDLDSVSAATRAALPQDRLIHVAEQESTDFEKALTRIDAPGVLALGLTGRRTDHELAAWHVLMRHPEPPCIVLGAEDIVFLAPLHMALDLPVGTRVSLFPMAPVAGRSTGLRWPIDGVGFAPGKAIGTSNRSTAPRVSLTFETRAMLVILPKTQLSAALSALI